MSWEKNSSLTTTTTSRVLTLSTISALSVLRGCGRTARHRQWQAQHSTDLSPLSAVHVKLRLQGFAGERRQLQELFMEKGHVVLVQSTQYAQQLFVLIITRWHGSGTKYTASPTNIYTVWLSEEEQWSACKPQTSNIKQSLAHCAESKFNWHQSWETTCRKWQQYHKQFKPHKTTL